MPMTSPGPPPAPGPPPGPPPPPSMPKFNSSKSKSNPDDRGASLQSIRQGKKLKKAVTIDKSGPCIPGKVSSSNNSGDSGRGAAPRPNLNNQGANGMALGGLFAGGMPKLRPTGKSIGGSQPSLAASNNSSTSNNQRTSPDSPRVNKFNGSSQSQLNDVLKKQMASDFRNRGPPPQPPPLLAKNGSVQDTVDTSNSVNKNSIVNQFVQKTTNTNTFQNQGNNSFLHNVSISNAQNNNNQNQQRPFAASHGKPNVAPKPPTIAPQTPQKPATPPKKIVINGRIPVTRAQSMRVPRSPPVAPPANPPFPPMVNGKDFSSMRGIPSAFHQSQENLTVKMTHSRNQTLPVNLNKTSAPPPPLLNNRPSGPPPSRPTVPPPPSRTGSNVNLKAPLSPPPPPPINAAPPVPSVATPPPPPPHRTVLAPPTRMPPAIPTNGPPPPPVRNSSMRNGSSNNSISPTYDLDARFANLFHPVADFPDPPVFQALHKIYSSRSALSKQQAPLPPNSIQLGTKLWDSSTC